MKNQDLLLSGVRELSHGNEQAALESFTRALADMEDAALGALCSARLHLLQREAAEAIRVLETLTAREPLMAEAHFLLGKAYQERCRLFDAIRSYRTVLSLDPSDQRAAQALDELLDVQEP